MFEIYKSPVYEKWFSKLRDRRAKEAIEARLDRLRLGNYGDVKPVGEGISEMRIHCGAGYRVYVTERGHRLVLLLCGGDKRTQDKDIKIAQQIAASMEF